MRTTFLIPESEIDEMATKHDLSDVIADIDTTCFCLDFYYPGEWWDYRRARRKLTHPAVAAWMETYGFKTFNDLPTAAIVAVCASLRRYLTAIEKGLNPSKLPITDGGPTK